MEKNNCARTSYSIYEKYLDLCESRGKAPSVAAIEAGISKSLPSKWKKDPNAIPNGTVLLKLSAYFNVPMEYFCSDQIAGEAPALATDVERIRMVCKSMGIKIAKLERDLHYGNGYLNPKKMASVSSQRLSEIADYIGVSVDMLLGRTKYCSQEAPNNISLDTICNLDDSELSEEERKDLLADLRDFYEFRKKQIINKRKK